MKVGKCLCALLLGTSLCAFSSYPVKAEPVSQPSLERVVIRYEELGDLIKNGNEAIKDAYHQVQFGLEDTIATQREFQIMASNYKEEVKGLKAQKDALIQSGKDQGIENIPGYYETLNQLSEAIIMYEGMKIGDQSIPGLIDQASMLASGYKKSVDQISDPGSPIYKGLQTAVDQMTMAAQSLMISYDSMMAQLEGLRLVEQLQNRVYQSTKTQETLGMATQAQVLEAKKEWDGAKSSLDALASAADQLKEQLCILIGEKADETVVFSMDSLEINRVEELSLEGDTKKAIGNNQSLIQLRHSEKKTNSYEMQLRLKSIEEGEQKVKSEMERLYKDVIDKKQQYDASQISLEKIRLEMDGAKRQYDLGIISQTQYQALTLQHKMSQASQKSVENALRQSLDTYQWARKGFLTLSY